jgi:hypothetical protein
MINYETGSWLLTTGALPDVDTPILLNWGTPIVTFVRSNLSVEKAGFEFDFGSAVTSNITVTWLLEGQTQTATSNNQGRFSGDAVGYINHNTGKGKLIPSKLPQKGTVFGMELSLGASEEQTIPDVELNSSNRLNLEIGNGLPIKPNSVCLEIPIQSSDGEYRDVIVLVDMQITPTSGKLIDLVSGIEYGTIAYEIGVCDVLPVKTIQVPKPQYGFSAIYASA